MIIALLSAKPIEEEKMKHIISKKLDIINNVQIALDKTGNLILYSIDFPKSLLSILYILSVSDYVYFFVGSEINALDAELALCVENSDIDEGLILKDDFSDITSFDRFFDKYKIGKFKKSDLISIAIERTKQKERDFKYVSIDKHFIVKGIGSVIIGFVLGQQIKKGEKLLLLPSLKQCSVKSIQIMDVDNDSAEADSHVGLALNNVSEQDLSNNYALSSINKVNDTIEIELTLSPFYKEDPFSKQLSCSFFGEPLSLNLLKDGSTVKAHFNRKIAEIKGTYLLADPSLSIGRNRVVGRIKLL
jgi:selenocysteine-specific translation elongation factor